MLESASVLGAQMSMWLGPHCRNSMMTDLAAPKDFALDSTLAAAAEAFQDKKSGRFNPNRPAPPTRINSRRDQPSQVRTGRPGIVSMSAAPCPRLYHRLTVPSALPNRIRSWTREWAGIGQDRESKADLVRRAKFERSR